MEFDEIEKGYSFNATFLVSDEMIRDFARITGDNNPLPLDVEFAKTTQFKRRIAHGMLVVSLISKVLGRDFPGAGTVYVSQFVKFRKPVYVGDTVEVQITVKDKNKEKRRLFLITNVLDNDQEVITGEAEIYLPE
jgi:3-hydroxybutyryl-CoA dehydratase